MKMQDALKVSDQRVFEDVQQLVTKQVSHLSLRQGVGSIVLQVANPPHQEGHVEAAKASQSGSFLPARPWKDDSDAPLEVLLSNEVCVPACLPACHRLLLAEQGAGRVEGAAADQ